MPSKVRIVGGHSSAFTGAAVVHQELARWLPEQVGSRSVVEDIRLEPTLSQRYRGDRRPDRSDVSIFTSTPLPLSTNSRANFTFIYDLRWCWTRGLLGRTYRRIDLLRTLRATKGVFVSSLGVVDQLRALRMMPPSEDQLTLLNFGPGQFEGLTSPPPRSGPPRVLLVGSAPHKRNELAASLLVQSARSGSNVEVVAISVSPATSQILRTGLAADGLELLDGLSRDELHKAYSSATTYLALGTSEGFGFPYMEAAHAGCDVVAVRQPLTIELFGDDANLLTSPTPTVAEIRTALASWEHGRVTRLQQRAAARSWSETAQQVAAAISPFLVS